VPLLGWADQVVIGPLMRFCWDKATLGQGRVVIGATAVLGQSSGDRSTDLFLLGQGYFGTGQVVIGATAVLGRSSGDRSTFCLFCLGQGANSAILAEPFTFLVGQTVLSGHFFGTGTNSVERTLFWDRERDLGTALGSSLRLALAVWLDAGWSSGGTLSAPSSW
jgi:hypothetical protein